MKSSTYFSSLIILFATLSLSLQLASLPHHIEERVAQINNLVASIQTKEGRLVFPPQIEGGINIQGLRSKRFQAKLVKNVRLPIFEELGEHGSNVREIKLKDTAFYSGSDGSFACKAKLVEGRYVCDLVGLLHDSDGNCFLTQGRAYCSEVIPGSGIVLDPQTDQPLQEEPSRAKDIPLVRNRRTIQQPSNVTNVISVGIYLDRAMMNRFKEINDESYDAGIADAELYCILLGNEWSYRYQTVKQWPDGLDLSVTVLAVRYPPENEDFQFMRYDSEGRLDMIDVLSRFRYDTGVQLLYKSDVGIVHHVMLVTGLELSSPGVVGVAYTGSMCNETSPHNVRRVSISRDIDYNVANIGAHEIAHAVGVNHDGDSGNPLTVSCNSNNFIMSPTVGGVNENNKDTFYTFSNCSSVQFTAHLNSVGNCLHAHDSTFVENFCQGPRGRLNPTSLNEQCERANGPGWTTCIADQQKVTANQCWEHRSVGCCNDTATNYIHTVVDGTPCEGEDPNLDYYCFVGSCTQVDTICETTPTPVQTPEPTAAPTTTTTTTTVATTPTPAPTCACGTNLCRWWSCRAGDYVCCS